MAVQGEAETEATPSRGAGRGVNQVILVGRLARDPELRVTAEGTPRAWFVLAVPRAFAAKNGERDADFVNIVAWRQLATAVGEHLNKGRLVAVTGKLQVSRLETGNGGKRTSTEVVADQIVFLDAPKKPVAAEP